MKKLYTILVMSALFASPALADSGSSQGNPSMAVGKSVANGSAITGLSVAVPLMVVGAAGGSIASASVTTLSTPLHVTEKTFVSRGPSPAEAMAENTTKKENQ
ncbi:MAG: hypothetical protein RLN89_03940 [Parvibaculum sp.]